MAIEVRLAMAADAGVVAMLINAMDRHYRGDAAPSLDATREMVEREICGAFGGTRVALAFDDGEPVGIALFAEVFPGAMLSGLLFLKDLFVLDRARGRGVGRALMRALARHARGRGLARIDLTTERPNRAAIGLYEGLGGRIVAEKLFVRFEAEALAAMAVDET